MFSIVVSALFTVCWLAVGIYTICHPPITATSYTCVWIMLVAFYAAQTIVAWRDYVKSLKNPK